MRRLLLLSAVMAVALSAPATAEFVYRATPGAPPITGGETPGNSFQLSSSSSSYRFDRGVGWSFLLAPAGGVAPYTYSPVDGFDATPSAEGLRISGPGEPGVFTVPAIQVTDSEGKIATSRSVRVTVGQDARLTSSVSELRDLTVTPTSAPVGRIVISNRGDLPTSRVPTPTVSGAFELASTTCTAVLQGDSACEVLVRGVATADGVLNGSLSVQGLASSISLHGVASGFAPDGVAGISASRWRIIADISWNPTNHGWMALAEIEFRSVSGQKINPENAGVPSQASELSSAYGIDKAVDGDTGTYLYARPQPASSQPPMEGRDVFEIILDYPSSIRPTELYIHSARDGQYGRNMPHEFLVQYHDGTTWTTTDHIQGISGWAVGGEAKTFEINGG